MTTIKRTKEINLFRVMRAIWQSGSISRVDIARVLKLDKSTVTFLVNDLLASHLVKEVAVGEAGPQGGRKPVFLTIEKDAGCVLGFEIQPEGYTAIAINLLGEILYEHSGSLVTRGANLVEVFLDLLETTAGRMRKRELSIIGAGVGVPGIIDQRRGVIHHSLPFGLSEMLDFRAAIAGKVDVPVFIENDANCCAWSELAFQRTAGLKNFLFALVEFRKGSAYPELYKGIAIGLGLVINGRVHYGADYSAGEFRSVFWKGPRPAQLALSDREMLEVETNKSARGRFIAELSKNLALFVNTLDLNQVFVGGAIEKYRDEVAPVLAEEIQRNWSYATKVPCEVSFSSLGDRSVAYGAAGMFLGQLFTHNYPVESDDVDDSTMSHILLDLIDKRSPDHLVAPMSGIAKREARIKAQ